MCRAMKLMPAMGGMRSAPRSIIGGENQTACGYESPAFRGGKMQRRISAVPSMEKR
jgi:hypothetical protein